MTGEYRESCSCSLNTASRHFWDARPKSSLGPPSPAAPQSPGESSATWTRQVTCARENLAHGLQAVPGKLSARREDFSRAATATSWLFDLSPAARLRPELRWGRRWRRIRRGHACFVN